MDNIRHVHHEDWKELETGEKPVFADFWAEWCGPCRAIAPIFEKLAAVYGDNFIFAKINVDEAPELAIRYGVQAIPTLILFQKGAVVERVVGGRSYKDLAALFERHRSPATKQ